MRPEHSSPEDHRRNKKRRKMAFRHFAQGTTVRVLEALPPQVSSTDGSDAAEQKKCLSALPGDLGEFCR